MGPGKTQKHFFEQLNPNNLTIFDKSSILCTNLHHSSPDGAHLIPGWEFTKLLMQIRNIFCNF